MLLEGEMKDYLIDLPVADIDLNDVKVTLDIICLTLPPQEDRNNCRPCYHRVTSYTSVVPSDDDADHLLERQPSNLSETNLADFE